MKKPFWSYARNGLIALGVSGALLTPAVAGPAGLAGEIAPATTLQVIPVQSTSPDYSDKPDRNFRNGQVWNNSHLKRRHLRHNNYWNDNNWNNNNRWDNYPRRHVRRHSGPSIYLGLGIAPALRYVEPRYVEPRYVQPRRVYRSTGLSQSHVNWCYDRYRSYRAYDNSFQPYNGPRQQCWSPYS